MLISKDEIKGLTPVAEGYKIFNYDWTADQNNYDFKDPMTNEAIGTVHKAEGKISCCNNGFHFCKEPLDCVLYYSPVTWNKFAKVRGYGQIAEHGEDSKVAVEILEIVRELTISDFVEACGKCGQNIHGGQAIFGGQDIYGGQAIYGGRNIHGGECCEGIRNIYYSRNLEAAKNCICCFNTSGLNKLFNKRIGKRKFEEIECKIRKLANGWFPKFNNAYELYDVVGKEWELVPPYKIMAMPREYAYSDMPQELVNYLTSLPEFDADIWYEITGRKDK